jgi:hypothetical protein
VLATPMMLATRGVAACGGGGLAGPSFDTTTGVLADSQRIVLSVRDDGTTDVVVQIGIPGSAPDFAMLIPTPTEPVVDNEPVATSSLDSLDADTAPTIHIDYGTESSSGGCSVGCGASDSLGDKSSNSGGGSVTVTQHFTVGPVTTATLTADTVDALSAWLDENGFVIPAERQDLIGEYVGPGRYFIAVRRTQPGNGVSQSIGLHYTLLGDHRKLSLAFARLGAAPTVAFTVFVAAKSVARPAAPFAALTLDDLDANILRRGAYFDAVKAAVHAHGSQAFVLESATPVTQGMAMPLAFLDAGAVITRMSTVVAADELTEDALLDVDFHGNVPASRTVMRGLPLLRYASTGWPPAVVLLRLLRRRRARKSRSA